MNTSHKELIEERDFTKSVLDSLSSHIAVLNQHGDIIMTNQAWKEFAKSNGGMHLSDNNYLQVLQNAVNFDPSNTKLKQTLENFQQMLAGQLNTISLEYPCHSPIDSGKCKRWFFMRANAFKYGQEKAIVVSHTNITERVLRELELAKVNKKLKLMSLSAQATNNAVVVTNKEGKIEWVNHGIEVMSGYTLSESLGQVPGHLLQGPDTLASTKKEIRAAIDARQSIQTEILNYHKMVCHIGLKWK